MRKALVVGIDYYDNFTRLHGCVRDAHSVAAALKNHGDGSPNFNVKTLMGTGKGDIITTKILSDSIRELFADNNEEAALFYFAGHGHRGDPDGHLLTSDASDAEAGYPLSTLLSLANKSKATNKIIILDSCHGGALGTFADHAIPMEEGLTILAAANKDQYATEEDGQGTFTTLFIDALSGGACNLVGEISPGSVYAHIDKSLGAWKQRPVFKTNVKQFICLRRVQPPIERADLIRINEFFPERGSHYSLDPSYEPEERGREPGMPPPDAEKTKIFAILQKYNRINLVVPVDAPHMWHAAMESKACRLTALGEHYRKLAKDERF